MLTVRFPGNHAWRQSLACDVLSDGKSVGQVVFPDRSRRSGIIELSDKRYTVSPTDSQEGKGRLAKLLTKGAIGPVAFEDSGGAVLGTATPSKIGFVLELGGAPFEFQRKSLFSANWVLQEPDGTPLGSIAYPGFLLSRTAEMSLPERFDDAQKCFLFWLCARWEMHQAASST